VNQTEADDYMALMTGFEAFELNWTIDGLMNSSSSASVEADGLVGDVNGTTLITETMTMTWTFSTTTADEHTIVIPYEGNGGDANDTIDITMETMTGWYFDSVSATEITISADGMELDVDAAGMAGITDDISIVITNVAPSDEPDDPEDDDDDDDGAPGFEAIAVAGAMVVALIAVRRRR
jgi:MYXO-CTERM domain-containing protein